MFGKRLPPLLLFIRINPKVIDVNVHPSKEEIKFESPQIISQLVGRAFQNTLRKDTFRSQIKSSEFKISPALQSADTGTRVTLDRSQYRNQPNSGSDINHSLTEVDFFRTENADLGTAIGQIHSTFILAQNDSGIVIIDMHAAHERINFEVLKEQWKKGQIQKQKALLPIEITVNEPEAEEIAQKKENLSQCGFEIERVGKTTITINEYPVVFTKKSILEAAMLTISNILKFDQTEKIDPQASKLLADMACKASLRAYDRITIDEMNNIIKKIETTENSAYCSHGRPVWRYMSIKELDKLFLRGQ